MVEAGRQDPLDEHPENLPRLRRGELADIAQSLGLRHTFKREEFVDAAFAYNETSGRPPLTRDQIMHLVKKALAILEDRGLLVPAGPQGYWTWRIADPPRRRKRKPHAPLEVSLGVRDRTRQGASQIISEGRQAAGVVYAYYFPVYQDLARHTKKVRWQIKIGMTTRTPAEVRIQEQIGTAMPERPQLAYKIEVLDAPALEQAIHGVLRSRGHRVLDVRGHEWFWTTPEEIDTIVDWVLDGPSGRKSESHKIGWEVGRRLHEVGEHHPRQYENDRLTVDQIEAYGIERAAAQAVYEAIRSMSGDSEGDPNRARRDEEKISDVLGLFAVPGLPALRAFFRYVDSTRDFLLAEMTMRHASEELQWHTGQQGFPPDEPRSS